MRILMIEDDEMVGANLEIALRDAGYSVDWFQDGKQGQAALAAGGYVAVLLDLTLPGMAGLSILKEARARDDRTPVVVLTARDGVSDRVGGLDLGADDYVVKPFELSELLARLRAVVRRRGGDAHSTIGSGSLQLDLVTREVIHGGDRTTVSAREFALLYALAERPGAVLSRQQLEERVYSWDEAVSSNAIEVIIHGLRRRFGNDVIRNVRGLGWKIPKASE